MKNKDLLIRGLILAMCLFAIGWELMALLRSHGGDMAQVSKQAVASGLLVWIIYVISKRQQDDDDLAGQY